MTAAAHVLFLDADFQPLRVAPLRKAMTKIATGKVEVVRFSADGTIRLVGQEQPAPAVVRVLRRFRRDKQRVRFSRINVYTRDKFTCQYCGDRFPPAGLTFDHVLPRSRGGATSWENIVSACTACNRQKANRTPREAGMQLARVPRRPFTLPVLTTKIDPTTMPPEWADYWTTDLDR